MALLDAAVRGHVEPGPVAHRLLGQVVVLADAADLVSQLAATGKYPVGGWGRARHPYTLATM